MPKILIVDDNDQNRYFLEVLLKGHGFETTRAANGAEALKSALETPPDIIISDILMPVMDGYALCREWMAHERLKKVPFIFYTATFTEPQDEELALNLGASRFVIKPQDPDILLQIINEVLEGHHANTAPAPTAPRPDEQQVLQEYNEALFRKLEKKMMELEKTNRELENTLKEQKRLEGQLRQAQKMEVIGRFAGGIAHDFNNILTAIVGYGHLMRMKMEGGNPLLAYVDQVLLATERAANLTRSLLTFSRKEEMKSRPVDLNDIIKNVEKFLKRIIGEDVQLNIVIKEEAIRIVADSGNIEQVLLNLATNARDAMPGGGILTIESEITVLDDQFVRAHGYGSPGTYALLSVSDSGEGMDEDTRQNIYEPFFTTKETGRGTGLGLSIVYGIVKQHNGFISVYSEPGHGTTFKILIPCTDDDSVADSPAGHVVPLGGNETILVAEDDAAIRRFAEEFLTSLGYRVLLAEDGQDAIDTFRQHREQIKLALIDTIMPRKNGLEVSEEIRAIQPGIKILFTSGHTADLIHDKGLIQEGAELITKPLRPYELSCKLREMLNAELCPMR
ncbi:response regulator [Geobacter sp. FeAm09]|uniref:response regulator n=1 Tax=Geobacter sp. FeAm09 TaxID=2597769 RepID=UPI00143D4EBC|nr:response regulator [Geobacter sp. FeAm09]